MDMIALLEALTEPTRLNVLRAIGTLDCEPEPGHAACCIKNETKEKFFQVMVGRIDLSELFGAQKAAEIALACGDQKISKMVMQQIAKQWKPLKTEFKIQSLITACKDPNPTHFVHAMNKLGRLKQHSVALAFYAAMGEAVPSFPSRKDPSRKLRLTAEEEATVLYAHFNAFRKFPSNMQALNCLCYLADFTSEKARAIIQEKARTNLELISDFTYGSDQQWCWLIDEIVGSGKLPKQIQNVATNKPSKWGLDTAGTIGPQDPIQIADGLWILEQSLLNSLQSRPEVVKHLKEMVIVTDVMQS